MTYFITPQRKKILQLLSLTMFSAEMLVDGGIFYSPLSTRKTQLRNAQKTLQLLCHSKYIDFHKYPHAQTSRYRRFYYLKNKNTQYHAIGAGRVEHDSITAQFLTHLFRCTYEKDISIKWYPPFEIEDKICDGAVSLAKDGKVTCSLILESDTGTHCHNEIQEKYQVYKQCLGGYPERRIVFLVKGEKRKENLKHTLYKLFSQTENAIYIPRIFFLCPFSFTPDKQLIP